MSAPARAPVCDEAALDPAEVVPALRMTTGLIAATDSATRMNSSPEPMLSR